MMITRLSSHLLILLAAAVLYFAVALTGQGEAHAQAPTSYPSTTAQAANELYIASPEKLRITIFGKLFDVGVYGNGQRTQKCSERDSSKGGVFLGKIMPCLTDSIKDTTAKFSAKIIVLFQPLFYFFLIFVITMFGVKVLQGEREIGVHAFVLVLKICFAVGMFQLIPTAIVPAAYNIISGGVDLTIGALEPTSFGELCGRDINKYGDANTPRVWMQMDCVIGKLFGFAVGTEKNPDGTPKVNMVLSSSIAGLMTGFFFGGTLGVALFFALVGTLWSVMTMLLKVVLAFLNGYLIVCVMLIISPIFLPLMFLKVTSDYFERWWKAILGGMMMPIIVAAYTVFALLMYDGLLFRQGSLLQTMFDQVRIEKALQHSSAPCDFNVTNDPSFKSVPGSEDMDKLIKSPFLQNFTQPLLSGGSNICGLFASTNFKITEIDGSEFKNGSKTFKKLFQEGLKLFIMAYLISAGLDAVQSKINALTGSSTASAAISVRTDTETKIKTAVASFQKKVSDNFSDNSQNGPTGSDFLKKFSDFLGSSVRK